MPLIPPSAPGAAQKDTKARLLWATGVLLARSSPSPAGSTTCRSSAERSSGTRAEENFVKEIRTPADRGLFLDRNGRVLVDSRPSYDITLTPYFCGKACDDVLDRVAAMVQMAPEEVDRARAQLRAARKLEVFRPFTVKVDIGREELDRFLANQTDLPGADVLPVPHRNYRYGSLGGHLLGYMNEVGPEELEKLNDGLSAGGQPAAGPTWLGDYVGRRGLEKRFESDLRGIDGKERVPVDAKGRRKADADSLIPEDQRLVPSSPGNNLVLSLDWRLQEFAEKTFPATAGVVVAMDAKTGFLLALVDRPAPDPNKMSGRITSAELAAIRSDPLQPDLFRAIQQHYHPGSTFKAVTAIAALEEGVLRPDSSIFCPGYFSMGRARWRCDKETGHGWVDFEHALGASCDVFFYEAGAKLGADSIAKWARRCGLGTAHRLRRGRRDPRRHPRRCLAQRSRARRLPAGHGRQPGHRAGGRERHPDAAGRLLHGAGHRHHLAPPGGDPHRGPGGQGPPDVRARRPRESSDIQKSTRDVVMKGLLAAVNQPFGTAYGSRVKEFTVAGKTGTAQVVKMGDHRVKAEHMPYFERDHAWFAAFAPAEDPGDRGGGAERALGLRLLQRCPHRHRPHQEVHGAQGPRRGRARRSGARHRSRRSPDARSHAGRCAGPSQLAHLARGRCRWRLTSRSRSRRTGGSSPTSPGTWPC